MSIDTYCGTGAGGIGSIIRLAVIVVKFLRLAIPIALIIFGMIDLGKAVIASKEDEMKKAQGTLLKRFLYAIMIFFVVTLVGFAMSLVGDATGEEEANWSVCWNKYWNE